MYDDLSTFRRLQMVREFCADLIESANLTAEYDTSIYGRAIADICIPFATIVDALASGDLDGVAAYIEMLRALAAADS